MALITKSPKTRDDLNTELQRLEWEYDLAQRGLEKGRRTVLLLIIVGPLTLALLLLNRQTIISGIYVVVVSVVTIFALVIYFAFVFGRVAKLKAEYTEKKKSLEMTAGDRVR